jgi:hypothetical protein
MTILEEESIITGINKVVLYALNSPDIKKLGFMMKQLYDMLDPKMIQYKSTFNTSQKQLNTSFSTNQVFKNRTRNNDIIPLLTNTEHKSDSPVLTLHQSPLRFPPGEPDPIVKNICEIVKKCPINNGYTLNALYLYLVTIFMDLHAKNYHIITTQRKELFNFSRDTLIAALNKRLKELTVFGKNILGTQTDFINELLLLIKKYNPYPEKPEQYRRAPNDLEAAGGKRLRNKTRRGLRTHLRTHSHKQSRTHLRKHKRRTTKPRK